MSAFLVIGSGFCCNRQNEYVTIRGVDETGVADKS